MALTVRPATHADLAKLDPVFHPMLWKGLVIQLARGPAAAVLEGEDIVAIAGLYPQAAEAELYFWVAPRMRGTRGAVGLVLALRRLMGLLPAGLKVMAAVKPGHAAGRRLARLLGFSPAGHVAGLALECWVYRHSLDGSGAGLASGIVERSEGRP